MPVCDKCTKQFGNRVKINGKIHMLNRRRFCLDCSPFGYKNRRDLTKTIGNFNTVLGHKICSSCAKPKELAEFHQSKSCCKICYAQKYNPSKRQRAADFRRTMKRKCIAYKGNACKKCGYDKYDAAMDFHHLNPEHKDFNISAKITTLTNFENIKLELDKCVLLCCRCHREVHEDPSLLHVILLKGK